MRFTNPLHLATATTAFFVGIAIMLSGCQSEQKVYSFDAYRLLFDCGASTAECHEACFAEHSADAYQTDDPQAERQRLLACTEGCERNAYECMPSEDSLVMIFGCHEGESAEEHAQHDDNPNNDQTWDESLNDNTGCNGQNDDSGDKPDAETDTGTDDDLEDWDWTDTSGQDDTDQGGKFDYDDADANETSEETAGEEESSDDEGDDNGIVDDDDGAAGQGGETDLGQQSNMSKCVSNYFVELEASQDLIETIDTDQTTFVAFKAQIDLAIRAFFNADKGFYTCTTDFQN